MGEIEKKHRKESGKGWKFWVLFVAVPIIVVLCSSLAFYGLYVKKKSSGGKQGFEKGLIYAKLNRNTEAITEFKKELEKNPENADIHYHLGISYVKLKEYDKAVAAFNAALKIKPSFSNARLQLSTIGLTQAIELRKLGESESIVLEKLLEAEDICREIIEKDPDFVQAYILLSEVHFSQGLIDDAITDYKQVLNIDNSSVNGHVALARLYMSKKNLDMARKECDLILSELEPDNKQAQFLLSTIYEQQGNHDEAVVLLKQILEKEPENVMAHTQLGLVYLKLSKYDEAIAEAWQVYELKPSVVPPAANFIVGSVQLQRKNYKEAISRLKETILRQPKIVEPHYFLALALAEEGRIEESKTEFKTAIDLAPEFVPAKLGLARLLSKAGWQKETIKLCKEILDLKPENVDAMQMLGQAYIKERDFENAEKQFEKVLGLKPSAGDLNMAYLNLVSGQLSKCIRQCEAILNTNPEEIEIYDILGLAHIRRGSFNSGIEQFKKALELNPRSSSTLLNLAKAYVITGKNDEARKTLENIISINPDDLNASTLLAGIYVKEGDIDGAAKALEKALEINPNYIQGYALAGMYFLQGKADESIDLYIKALRLDPDNAILHMNLAVVYQHKENYDAAIASCERAISLKPGIPAFKLALTNNYAAKGDFSKAKEQVESISSFSHDQMNAYLGLLDTCQLNSEKGKQIMLALNKAVFSRQAGLFDLAISECKKAIEIFPENVVPKVILANTYLSATRNEEAIAVYSEIIKDKPEFASSYYDLGRAYLMTDKQDEAASMYQDMIDIDKKSVSGRLALAGILVKQGDTDKAAKIVEDVVALEPENLVALNLLGEMSLANEDYEKAEKEFSKMIELRSNTFEGHFNMARMNFAQGDFDKCIEHGKEALITRPVDVRIHNILGMAYMRKGMINDAVIEFNKIIDINSDFIPAYLNLANINMAARKPDTAAILYKAALKVKPDAVEARLGLGNSYTLMGNYSNAVTEFESIINKYPNNVNAYISLARSYMAMDDNIKAQETAVNALSIETNNPIVRSILAKIYVKKEDVPQAINQLKQVLSNNQKVLSMYDLGILYIDVEEYQNAILTYKQGIENFPENILLWCNLAVAYQMNKDFKGAKDACIKALNIEPDGIVPNLCMINIFLAKGEFGNARRHLKTMVKLDEVQKRKYLELVEICDQNNELADKISYHLARAMAYTNNRWFKRIVREYDEITKIAPTSTFAYYAQVDNLILMGEIDKATDICKKIVELEPESPDSHNKLAGIYTRKGETDEALAQYRKAISIDQDNFAAHLNVGIILESKGLLKESVNAYKNAITLNPTSPVAYNNLAWLYASRMQNKIEEALKLAKKAKEILPNNPAVIDTLGWIYYLGGIYDKALSELRVAAQSATWNPTIRYHLGMVYYKNGLQREALAELEQALKINNTFPEAEEAKALIEEIISKIKSTGKEVSMLQLSYYG
jgi:tetratricopeptide (TPR) repeat protein